MPKYDKTQHNKTDSAILWS